jgi:methylated-thiol--corrinoid protein
MVLHLDLLIEKIFEVREKDPARYDHLVNEGLLTELGFDVNAKGLKTDTLEDIRARYRPENPSYAEIADAVIAGNKPKVKERTAALIAQGADPVDLVSNALMPGIQAQCELYDLGKAYVPEILISSNTMLEGIRLAQEKLGDVPKKGTVATFVVEGDLHDIGKNIVAAILRANGFEVLDLGRDVPAERVIDTIRSGKLILVNGSTLMSTTKGSLKQIAEMIKDGKLDVPLAAGGSAVSKTFVETFDNAVYGKSPIDAVRIAEKVASGKDWRTVREEQH